jgi:hypothetical protein
MVASLHLHHRSSHCGCPVRAAALADALFGWLRMAGCAYRNREPTNPIARRAVSPCCMCLRGRRRVRWDEQLALDSTMSLACWHRF